MKKQNELKPGRIILVVILLLIVITCTYLAVRPKDITITPYTGKQVDVIINNEGMNFVGTIAYPEDIDEPCPAVLLLPGFMGERDELPVANTSVLAEGGRPKGMLEKTALKLAEAGYVSMRIDYRYSGKSEGLWQDITATGELSDAKVALKYLSENPAVDKNRLAVCGLSLGGALASCISDEPLVKIVVLWSPASELDVLKDEIFQSEGQLELEEEGIVTLTMPWGETTTLKKTFFDSLEDLHPLKEITIFKGPLLCICGKKDPVIAPQPQQTLKFIDAHNGEEKLILIDADHTFDNFLGFEKLDQAIDETRNWLDIYLKP